MSELQPSRRQIVFNWIMGDDLSNPHGWWGGSEEVESIDKLLAALDAVQPVAAPGREKEGRDGMD